MRLLNPNHVYFILPHTVPASDLNTPYGVLAEDLSYDETHRRLEFVILLMIQGEKRYEAK